MKTPSFKANILEKIANLSPEKKALLDKKISQQLGCEYPEKKFPANNNSNEIPISYAQKRLLRIQQLQKNSPVLNAYRSWYIKGQLDLDALHKALIEIVFRHGALRTAFLQKNGDLVQISTQVDMVKFPIINLTNETSAEQQDSVLAIALNEFSLPFDLSQAPLFRVKLLQLNNDEYILLFTFHHIVLDGWSMGIMHRELETLYANFSSDNPSSLPDLAIQYHDILFWQQDRLQKGFFDVQIRYWRDLLADIPKLLEFPSSFSPRPPALSFRGERFVFVLNDSLRAALKRLGESASATLFMTLLAAFQALLYQHTGQKKIVVGSPIAQRTKPELEDLIGLFVNPLIFCTDFSDNPTFRAVLIQVRKNALQAFSNQEVTFEQLLEEFRTPIFNDRHPIFQVGFTLQNMHCQNLELSGLTIEPYEFGSISPFKLGNNTAKLDLTLSLIEQEDGLKGMFEYSTDLFSSTAIKQLFRDFKTLLGKIVDNPDIYIFEQAQK